MSTETTVPEPESANGTVRQHDGERGTRMIKWAGWILVACGAVHTIAALTVHEAASHAGAWFSGELWGEDLSAMGPASSAYWLSWDSFGVPLILIGLTVLWLDRRGITPPAFIAWTLGVWNLVDTVVLGMFVTSLIFLLPTVLLLLGARRAAGSRA